VRNAILLAIRAGVVPDLGPKGRLREAAEAVPTSAALTSERFTVSRDRTSQ
jgi:hypothetical protein